MFGRLLHLGIYPELDFHEKNKLKVFNSACLFALCVSCFYFVYGTLSGFYLAELMSLFLFLMLVLSLYFVSKRRYRTGFHLGVISSFIFISSFTLLFGDESKSYYYFLFMPVASTILFDSRNTSVKYLLVSIVCLLSNVAYAEFLPPYYDVHNMWYFGYPNMVFTLLLIFMGLRVFKNENRNYAEQIEEQKHTLQEKNKALTDSINYARRIQYTLLAHRQLLDQQLPDYFVLFRPKDIVSGDFYWASGKNDLFYLAICDSTGHGVPGAFMSLLNISFLNEALNEADIIRPDEILNFVRQRLIATVSQEGARDGMDAVLIRYDRKKRRLDYSAANNAPILIREGAAQVLPKDKMPVGQGEKKEGFTLHSIELQEGDQLYLFTDGFADQFGGPAGKKFKLKQLEALLLQHNHHPTNRQQELIESAFMNWKGSLEQVDDVCIAGIRF